MSSLGTAIHILHCFSAEHPELRVSDVSRRLGVPKSTVTRLFKQMLQHGLVEQDRRSRQYRPGPLAFQLGTLYQARLGILDLVEQAVERLVDEFGLTGYVGVLDGADVVLLRVRQGTYPVRMILDAGLRVPAFTTAIGEVLLARLETGAITAMHAELLHYPTTDFRITRSDLLKEIEAVRVVGWADARARVYPGFGAVAVAVGAADGQQALAFCLSYPIGSRFDEMRPAMAARLTAEAVQIGRRAGDAYWLEWAKREAPSGELPDAPHDIRPLAGAMTV